MKDKISFITTVYNEERTISDFLKSLFAQTKLADEIIIVDGGSTDKTIEIISSLKSQFIKKQKKISFKFFIKRGNRSVGRNEAIKNATGEIIACSDAGNILDKNWIKNIVKPFTDKKVDVVAGYYKGKAKNVFQKCLIPYVLVMPDQVDPDNFLPATRSIAFKKSIWKKIGGFDETLSHNEDYVFANRLKDMHANIVFAKDAIVYWLPRNNLKETFVMFFRFALGDAEASIIRAKVLLIFTRYFLGFYFLFLCLLYKSLPGYLLLILCLVSYIIWASKKNYRYIKDTKALFILPLLQFTADFAVLSGTSLGILKQIIHINYISLLKQNKFLFVILICYGILTVTVMRWGIPNQNHPFPYHMDEWHQLQAVANTFRYGTPNTAGSANGTMFHFIFSGFYLIPFTALHIINPFELQIDNGFMRERVFEVLRLQSILFGLLTIIVMYKLASLLQLSRKLTIFLFTFSPIWLMLSGYFKYDIALLFWIVLSLFFLFRFAYEPTNRNFLLAAIPLGVAIAVKISAIPLIPIYIVSYFLFSSSWRKSLKFLLIGLGILSFGVIIFGMPDTLFGKGNILDYLYDNILHSPQTTPNYMLHMHTLTYLFTRHYPVVFGYGLIITFLLSLVIIFYQINKKEIFILFSFLIFVLSILPLQILAGGNRSLVLLPFFVLIIGIVYKNLSTTRFKYGVTVLLIFVSIVQLYQCFAWVYMKVVNSPQENASVWIVNNIKSQTTIGLENIPIYQLLPDLLQKEFYLEQYKKSFANRYTYQVIDSKSKKLPEVVVITDGQIAKQLFKNSPKKDLLKRLKQEKYQRIAEFTPDYTFYKLFGNETDFYLSGFLVASPTTVEVYKK